MSVRGHAFITHAFTGSPATLSRFAQYMLLSRLARSSSLTRKTMKSLLPLQLLLGFSALLFLSRSPALAADAAKKPNILWIVSEDNDPFLG